LENRTEEEKQKEINKADKRRYFPHWKTRAREEKQNICKKEKEKQKEKTSVFLALENRREEEKQKEISNEEKRRYFPQWKA